MTVTPFKRSVCRVLVAILGQRRRVELLNQHVATVTKGICERFAWWLCAHLGSRILFGGISPSCSNSKSLASCDLFASRAYGKQSATLDLNSWLTQHRSCRRKQLGREQTECHVGRD
eukprot:839320-Amphidinium_carterae.1